MSDEELEKRLFPPPGDNEAKKQRLPDWKTIHKELRKQGVTLALLWHEYRLEHPEGYCYSQFCELYRKWRGRLSLSMRQSHIAGERMFVDYSGDSIPVIDPLTGEARKTELFIAAMGASNYTSRFPVPRCAPSSPLVAEATWTQGLSDWTGSHVRAFEYFGGVPALVVPDNLKSAVVKVCFYEPDVNRSYGDLARHYDTAILPARPRKPKDKAKAEVAVQVAHFR